MKNIKLFNNRNKGYTLIELLIVIVILSVLSSIAIYFGLNLVKNAKENSYKVTINNIEKEANNYVMEELSSIHWVNGNTGNYQYQCVTVKNLIDAGYFKGDVLESKVSDNRKVLDSDYVYLERDSNTKSITKSIMLVGDLSGYVSYCQNINISGDISISVEPIDWSREKDVTIIYKLTNSKDFSKYKYSYKYIFTNGNADLSNKKSNIVFNDDTVRESFTVLDNGNVNASINGSGVNISKTLTINKIDRKNPTAVISSTNNVASSQTVTLTMGDSLSGVAEYYFGKDNPSTSDVDWVSVDVNNSVVKSGTVDSSGRWYLGVKDLVGNIKVVYKNFYITNLVVTNEKATPSAVITMAGNSFKIPTPSVSSGYLFSGWYKTRNFSGSKITSYKPTSNASLYAKVTKTGKVNIRYNVNGGVVNSSTGSNKWTSNSSGLVYKNGAILTQKVNYGDRLGTDGLSNYNNSNYLKISKTGYKAVSGSEWICLEGTCKNKKYSQTQRYYASDFCDASKSDCTVVLGVNWDDSVPPVIEFGTNGSDGKWVKTATTAISVTDSGSGVDTSTFKFVFSKTSSIDFETTKLPNATSSEIVPDKIYSFANNASYSMYNENDRYYLHAYACDKVGNCTTSVSKLFLLDNIAPVVTCDNSVAKYTQKISDTNYRDLTLTIEDECTVHGYLYNVVSNGSCRGCGSLIVSDNNWVFSVDCSSKNYNEDNREVTDYKATNGNCNDGFCRSVYTKVACDEAGNCGSNSFTYKVMYDFTLTW